MKAYASIDNSHRSADIRQKRGRPGLAMSLIQVDLSLYWIPFRSQNVPMYPGGHSQMKLLTCRTHVALF